MKRSAAKQARAQRFISTAVNAPSIQEQVRDLREVQYWWAKSGRYFVPFSSSSHYTSHATLSFLLNLAQMSPTGAGVVNSKYYIAMGGPLEITRRYDAEWDLEREELTDQKLKRLYYDTNMSRVKFFLNNEFNPVSPKQFMEAVMGDDMATGNAYIEEASVEVGGVVYTNYYLKPQQNCLYLADNTTRMMAINPLFGSALYRESDTQVLPTGEQAMDDGGVLRRMWHIKNGGDWYGRPKDQAVIPHKYLEWQMVDYLNVMHSTRMVGDVIFRMTRSPILGGVFGGDSEEGSGKAQDEADEITESLLQYTNEAGDPMGFVVMMDPVGGEPSSVTQLKPVTDGEFYEKKAVELRNHICVNTGWSPRLLGITEATGLSSNIVLEEFALRAGTTVQELQIRYGGILTDLFYRNQQYNNDAQLMELSVDFSSPYKNMLDATRQLGGASGNGT